jgi:predicted small lipoprotein YifL
MGKKSNKSNMRKQIAIIFISVLSFTAITGCGIKGPLYQTPEQQQGNLPKNADKPEIKNNGGKSIEE